MILTRYRERKERDQQLRPRKKANETTKFNANTDQIGQPAKR